MIGRNSCHQWQLNGANTCHWWQLFDVGGYAGAPVAGHPRHVPVGPQPGVRAVELEQAGALQLGEVPVQGPLRHPRAVEAVEVGEGQYLDAGQDV